MTSKKYPLEPLAHVRERRTDAAKRDLADAIRAREADERRKRAAELERDKAHSAAADVRARERRALERGELSAGDLARAGAWELRAKDELSRADAQVEHAQARETGARAKEADATGALASRRAEERVVDAHRDRFREAARKSAEAKEEEVNAEAWRPRRA